MLNAALDLGGIVLDNIKLVALPCLCADVFFGTDEIRAGAYSASTEHGFRKHLNSHSGYI